MSKKILGPVHLHPKTDKWDYLRSPIMKKKIVSCFDIGEVPRIPRKWNWNWLYFLPFIFTFKQGGDPLYFQRDSKGQKILKWKYEIVALPKTWKKMFEKFCPEDFKGRIFQIFSMIFWATRRLHIFILKFSDL